MRESSRTDSESESPGRATLRREQILGAAASCFSRHGFHGASMSEISREAGMSVGHIYHYFSNKEAIIAAIVEREQQRVLRINADIRRYESWAEGMIDLVARAVSENIDSRERALLLEMLAEAARNPAVANRLQEADVEVRRQIAETLAVASNQPEGLTDLSARTEVLAALFEGLHSRAIRNPQIDHVAITRVIQQVLRGLLEP